ncbi:MAG: cupin domain-containing protein [Desulfobacteraceae bacterium]|nr:MAG: cupin domain-containing protein [Desulfobacteraceae bacterium]
MPARKFVHRLKEAEAKPTHGGAALFRILLDESNCGAKNFSFLVNTMKAGLNCNMTGTGHSHREEHCMFTLSGKGGIIIDGEKFDLEPNMAVFVPPGAMHFMWAEPEEDFTYIVVYSPPGPEKEL